MPRLFSLLLIFAWAGNAAALPSVYASVPPIAAIAGEVGGPAIHVQSLLRPGDNPVTFSPTPRQLAHLADSVLFLRVGVPFENAWIRRIRAINPTLTILDVREGLDLAALPEHHHHGSGSQHDSEALDPHVWTDPLAIIRMSETIRDALIRVDPAHASDYRQRQQALAVRLHNLDRTLHSQLAPFEGQTLLVFHPAWGYFARRYGLHQLAIQHEGKQSGARWMAKLIEKARREGIHVIVVQPQFDRRLAQQIAHAIDGRVVSVDPLSPDYQGSLRRLARVIAGDNP